MAKLLIDLNEFTKSDKTSTLSALEYLAKINAFELLDFNLNRDVTDVWQIVNLKRLNHLGGFCISEDNKIIYVDSLSGIINAIRFAKSERYETGTWYEPKIEERIVMLDCGRKYYDMDFFKELIDFMSNLNMTHLQLHFSDNEGFRIESTVYPEIVSKKHLTQDEVAEIIEYAHKNNISIIPELDSPGHLNKFLIAFPNFRLANSNALDIINKDAVDVIMRLYDEYFELFQYSEYFHIGGDEFVDFNQIQNYPKLLQASRDKYGEQADGTEVYIDYINKLGQYVLDAGFKPRVWNDGFFRLNQSQLTKLDDIFEISYWTRWDKNMATLQTYLNHNYQLINCNDNYFYFVLGEKAGYKYPDAEKISTEWKWDLFSGQQKISESDFHKYKGVQFSIWADDAKALTQEQVLEMIQSPLIAFNEGIWQESEMIV